MNNLPKIPDDQYLSVTKEGLQYIINNFDPNIPEKNFLWTTDYKVELPLKIKKSGKGSEKPYTISQAWKRSLSKFGDHAALTYESKPNKWTSVTYKQYFQKSIEFAKALIALKINQYSAVNIIGFNCVQWAYAFFGSIFGHYLPIGLYTTNGPEACAYIANHSQAQIIIMEDASHLTKYISIMKQTPKLKYYVLWKGAVPANIPNQLKGRVFTWAQFIAYGQKNYKPEKKQDTLQYRMDAAKPGNCATFIYTSGTTGPPKAVMISHDNYTWVSDSTIDLFSFNSPQKQGKQRVLSLLPLSHVAAQLVDLVLAVINGAHVFFCDASALQGNLVKFLQISRPTLFSSVPRVYEKIQQRIMAVGAQTTGLKRKIADWAKSIGAEGTYAQVNGGPTPRGWSIAKKLVFNKIKQNLGLDKCQVFIFAAAPLKQSTRLFFLNLNIYLRNIFGMSELSGPQTTTNPKAFKNFSSIQALKQAGQALPGLQLAISNPDHDGNGQICCRGRNVFMGYYKNQKQTKQCVDSKGFVHSGDVGMVKNNVLTITGRIKELIITAGGQNVAPVLIQNEINTALPIFSHVVVVGDKQKFLGCLLTLKMKSPGVLAEQVISIIKPKGSNATTMKQALACTALKKIINDGIQVANKKAISNAQKVQKFVILPAEFSIDTGELTPTMKLKRKIINQKYEAQISQLYEIPKL